jgi:hypothetical protein
MGALVTFPWCVDTHAAPQQSGVAGLQNRIDRVLDNDWIGSFRLCRVPCVHLLVDGRQGFGFVDKRLGLGVAGLGGEQRQRRQADIRLQRFPGLMAYRACRTS